MKQSIFSDPAIGIILAQLLLAWSLVISHYGSKNFARKLTLILALPLTIIGLYIGYSRAVADQSTQNQQFRYLENLDQQTTRAIKKIESINAELTGLGENIIEVRGDINLTSKTLSGELNTTRVELTGLQNDLKDLRGQLDKSRQAIANMRTGIDKIIEIQNVTQQATLEAFNKRQQADKKFWDCVESNKQHESGFGGFKGFGYTPCKYGSQ